MESGSVAQQIEMDTRFHCFLYELSGNPLIAETTKPPLGLSAAGDGGGAARGRQRTRSLWDEHAGILDAVAEGDGDRAETLARQHILRASDIFVARLKAQHEAAAEADNDQSLSLRRLVR